VVYSRVNPLCLSYHFSLSGENETTLTSSSDPTTLAAARKNLTNAEQPVSAVVLPLQYHQEPFHNQAIVRSDGCYYRDAGVLFHQLVVLRKDFSISTRLCCFAPKDCNNVTIPLRVSNIQKRDKRILSSRRVVENGFVVPDTENDISSQIHTGVYPLRRNLSTKRKTALRESSNVQRYGFELVYKQCLMKLELDDNSGDEILHRLQNLTNYIRNSAEIPTGTM
jgi:hypothetical protein